MLAAKLSMHTVDPGNLDLMLAERFAVCLHRHYRTRSHTGAHETVYSCTDIERRLVERFRGSCGVTEEDALRRLILISARLRLEELVARRANAPHQASE